MNREEAIEYIVSRVRPDDDEPVFVFLGRDSLASGALRYYRRALEDYSQYTKTRKVAGAAANLRRKAEGMAAIIDAFEECAVQRLPGTEEAPRE